MMKQTKAITVYKCPVCDEVYETIKDAENCAVSTVKTPKFEIGDIIKCTFVQFALKNCGNDPKWIIDDIKGLQPDDWVSVYYVVTHIRVHGDDPHSLQYSLFTNAKEDTGKHDSQYLVGHNDSRFIKINNPPEHIINTAKNLIGKKAHCLA